MLSALCPCLGDSELNGWEEMAGCRAIGFVERVWDMGPTAQAQVRARAIHLPGGGLRRGDGGAAQEGEMDGTLSQRIRAAGLLTSAGPSSTGTPPLASILLLSSALPSCVHSL